MAAIMADGNLKNEELSYEERKKQGRFELTEEEVAEMLEG